MKVIMENILQAANLYAQGLTNVNARREAWLQKLPEIKQQLKTIAKYLNENAAYKPGYYVDTFYAYDEEIKGICMRMPSLGFRSGVMPMFLDFSNEEHKTKGYKESGFRINFSPIVTGQVVVTIVYHSNAFIQTDPPYEAMEVFDNPLEITTEVVEALLARGIEEAYYSSYTGLAEKKQMPYTPIGFKTQRTETTEPDNNEEEQRQFILPAAKHRGNGGK